MSTYSRWQSRTALLIALGITSTAAVPIVISAPAIASKEPYVVGQRLPRSSRLTVPVGTVIPVRYDQAERIIVTPEETSPVTLTVAEDILSDDGIVVIPAGSQIEGELQPAEGGTQFVSEDLILANTEQRLPINATSAVITETETITEKSDPDILKGAAIGAAAGAVIGEIFGGIDLGEVLGGAGVGVLASVLLRGEKEVEVVNVDPETDLNLTLQSDLVPSRRVVR